MDSASPIPTRTKRPSAVRRFFSSGVNTVSFAICVIFVLIALTAPWIAPFDPNAINPLKIIQPPSTTHLFGTDDLGRDVFSRFLYGAQISLLAAVQAVSIAALIGVPFGLVAGYSSGFWSSALTLLNDALMAFPGLILAIAIIGVRGPGLTNAMIAVGIIFIPRFFRIARAGAISLREETYIEAARSIGCSNLRIIARHVLPNLVSPLVVQISLTMALAIVTEAALSYLGLGVQSPQASWGSMMRRAYSYMSEVPIQIIAPGVALMLLILAFNLIGDGIQSALGRSKE